MYKETNKYERRHKIKTTPPKSASLKLINIFFEVPGSQRTEKVLIKTNVKKAYL